MKHLIVLACLSFSLFSYAQDDLDFKQYGQALDAKFSTNDTGVAGVEGKLGLWNNNYTLSGSYGIAPNDKRIGAVDVEFRTNELGSPKKLRVFFGYSPLYYDSSALTETVEAFFNIKGGLKIDKTTLTYGVSPFSSFTNRDTNEIREAIFHNVGLEQTIGDSVKIIGQLKTGKLYVQDEIPSSGKYLQAKSEISVKLGGPFSVLAFYELEDYNFMSRSPAVVDSDSAPKEIKQTLGTAGVGLRVSLQ